LQAERDLRGGWLIRTAIGLRDGAFVPVASCTAIGGTDWTLTEAEAPLGKSSASSKTEQSGLRRDSEVRITGKTGMVRVAAFLAVIALPASGQTDWPTYGYDLEGTRYSPLEQINTENVGGLVRAWTYNMPPTERRAGD